MFLSMLKMWATVHLGPDLRYGVAELNGQGEAVGGIVVMRYGENALKVVDGIKKKIEEIKTSLPPGVRILPTYDRSTLIYRAIDTLREKLLEESIVVAVISVLFLWHVRSALVAIITLPVAIILSFIPMLWLGLTSNIMSLGGIAIAIGAMVDAAIIMVENAHKASSAFARSMVAMLIGRERFDVDRRRCADCRTPFVLFSACHHGELRSGLLFASAGRTTLSTAGVHENILHVFRVGPWIGAGSRPDDVADPRQDHAGEKESDQRSFDRSI